MKQETIKPPALVQSRAGPVFLIPFTSWMMMSRQPQRGTERCIGNLLGMGRMVKDPWNRAIDGANSQEGEEKGNKKALLFLSEELTGPIYSLLIYSLLHPHAHELHFTESPHSQHLCAGTVTPCQTPACPFFPSCSHRLMAPQCLLLTHLPAVHLKAIIIKERVWSNSIPLLSQGTATGSHRVGLCQGQWPTADTSRGRENKPVVPFSQLCLDWEFCLWVYPRESCSCRKANLTKGSHCHLSESTQQNASSTCTSH